MTIRLTDNAVSGRWAGFSNSFIIDEVTISHDIQLTIDMYREMAFDLDLENMKGEILEIAVQPA